MTAGSGAADDPRAAGIAAAWTPAAGTAPPGVSPVTCPPAAPGGSARPGNGRTNHAAARAATPSLYQHAIGSPFSEKANPSEKSRQPTPLVRPYPRFPAFAASRMALKVVRVVMTSGSMRSSITAARPQASAASKTGKKSSVRSTQAPKAP